MNFSQKFGLFILIMISVTYVYFSFFHNNSTNITRQDKPAIYNPLEESGIDKNIQKKADKDIKIFLLNNSGNLQAIKRKCDSNIEDSCFRFAIKELIAGPTKWEKNNGYTSEIPQGTKVLSIRESENSIMIDLSSEFESGGGAESTYMRVRQIIKTANTNSSIPTYLYINGKQANVIGGEGIMIKQPLNERSFDE